MGPTIDVGLAQGMAKPMTHKWLMSNALNSQTSCVSCIDRAPHAIHAQCMQVAQPGQVLLRVDRTAWALTYARQCMVSHPVQDHKHTHNICTPHVLNTIVGIDLASSTAISIVLTSNTINIPFNSSIAIIIIFDSSTTISINLAPARPTRPIIAKEGIRVSTPTLHAPTWYAQKECIICSSSYSPELSSLS